MNPGEADNGFEYLIRRLGELQEEVRTVRIEVDRFSGKAKSMILENSSR